MVTDSSPGGDGMLHMDPETVRKHFDRIGCFRILVIGRSNAGKTTLLQRVCNTTELPEVFNAKGEKVKCLVALFGEVIYEYSQLDPTVVQGSLEVGLTIQVRDTNRLIIMLRGEIMTFYILLISWLGLARVILVFDTVIHTNKGVFDLY